MENVPAVFDNSKVKMGVSTLATNRLIQSNGIFSPQQILQRSSIEFAVMYLTRMRDTFIKYDQPQIYNSFINIMKDYKAQIINFPTVITEVRHLFHDHPELISGFNAFLPGGYKINMSAYAVAQLEDGHSPVITEKNIRPSTLPIANTRQGTEDFYQQVFQRSVVEHRPPYHPNEDEHLRMISRNHPTNFY